MITSHQRALTDKERSLIARRARERRSLANDIASAGCLTMVAFAPAAAILKWLELERWQPFAACLALVVGIATALNMRLKYGKLVPRPLAYDEDLRTGLAKESTYEVVDAIRVEELEDLGSNYYLRLANDRVLFLSGQYLYELEDEKRFPCTRVRRSIAPRSGVLLNFECLGDYFPPSSTRPSFTEDQYKFRRVPDDGAILEADFETLRHGAA